MANPQTQINTLSEDRDPLETPNYALKKGRGQESQQRISRTQAQTLHGSGINLIQCARQQSTRRSILPTPTNNNKIQNPNKKARKQSLRNRSQNWRVQTLQQQQKSM